MYLIFLNFMLKFRLCTHTIPCPWGYMGLSVINCCYNALNWELNKYLKKDRQIWPDAARYMTTKFSSIATHIQICHNTGTNITHSLCGHITLCMFSLQQKDGSMLQTEINQSHRHLHLCCKHQELRWGLHQWSYTTIPENKIISWQSDMWVFQEESSWRLLHSVMWPHTV